MDLTTHQKVAIRSPCFDAEECAQAKFGWRSLDQTVTVLLTMNIGME